MNKQQLIKIANAYRQSTEKRAFLGGLGRLINILARTPAGRKLIPKATQLAKESPKAWKALTEKNVGKMLKRPTMPGMKPPPLPPPPLPPRIPKRPVDLGPGMYPSRLPPPPPISTRVPNPNFRPQPPGSSMWRPPGM